MHSHSSSDKEFCLKVCEDSVVEQENTMLFYSTEGRFEEDQNSAKFYDDKLCCDTPMKACFVIGFRPRHNRCSYVCLA